jgi:hypothetical protein
MSEEKINLDTTLKPLQAIRRKLRSISKKELKEMKPEPQTPEAETPEPETPTPQEEWANNLQTVSVAITKLEAAKLKALSDEFKKREPELRESAIKLKADLSQLENAVQIIRVASNGLKIIEEIIRLLK